MKTVKDLAPAGGTCYIAKKGSRYVCERNGELALTLNRTQALAFNTEVELDKFIEYAAIDTRNASVIGRGYYNVALHFHQPTTTPTN